MKLKIIVLAAMGLFTSVMMAQQSPANKVTPCMEGMVMPGCPPKNGEQYQNMPDMSGMKMGEQHSQSPDTHATMTLQEPENPGQKTGSNLPAPELLQDVASRPSMSLA